MSTASYSIANLLSLGCLLWEDGHRMVSLPFDVSTGWEEVRPSQATTVEEEYAPPRY